MTTRTQQIQFYCQIVLMKELSLLSTCLWRAKGHICYLSYFIWFFLYKAPTSLSVYFGFIRKNNHTPICLYSMPFISAPEPQEMLSGTGPLKTHKPASALLHTLLMKINTGSQLHQNYCAWLQAVARSSLPSAIVLYVKSLLRKPKVKIEEQRCCFCRWISGRQQPLSLTFR